MTQDGPDRRAALHSQVFFAPKPRQLERRFGELRVGNGGSLWGGEATSPAAQGRPPKQLRLLAGERAQEGCCCWEKAEPPGGGSPDRTAMLTGPGRQEEGKGRAPIKLTASPEGRGLWETCQEELQSGQQVLKGEGREGREAKRQQEEIKRERGEEEGWSAKLQGHGGMLLPLPCMPSALKPGMERLVEIAPCCEQKALCTRSVALS